jgi:hypothetical protein
VGDGVVVKSEDSERDMGLGEREREKLLKRFRLVGE